MSNEQTDSKSPKDKRPAPISYRPPAELRGAFYERVQRSGLSVNAYIHQCVFKTDPPRQSRRPAVEATDLARLLAHAAAIRDDLKRFETPDSDAEMRSLLGQAVAALSELRNGVMNLMGRRR